MGRNRKTHCNFGHDLTIYGARKILKHLAPSGKPYTSGYCTLCKAGSDTKKHMDLAERQLRERTNLPKKKPSRTYLPRENEPRDDVHALAKAIIERGDILRGSMLSFEEFARKLARRRA